MKTKKIVDKTAAARQARRRKKLRKWIRAHGFKSWEAIQTALVSGLFDLVERKGRKSL